MLTASTNRPRSSLSWRHLGGALMLLAVLAPIAALRAGQTQASRGSLAGAVTDISGNAISGAKVVALNLDTGVINRVLTDAQGRYSVSDLPIGIYKVRISAQSFASAVQGRVQIDAKDVRVVDAHLRVPKSGEDGDTILAPYHPRPPEELANLQRSPVIKSISVTTSPLMPFESNGDLWFTTWADDDHLYGTWGDGRGPTTDRTNNSLRTDTGIVMFSGAPPTLIPKVLLRDAPTETSPPVDNKPSSVLFFGKRLYGDFHSPLGDGRIGYLAYSDDHGLSWKRVGFYLPNGPTPREASPWTRDNDSPFRCLFLINMGEDYQLNKDGFVYGLAIGREYNWNGPVYLARVKKENILNYAAWEYLSGITNDTPRWSQVQKNAVPVPGLHTWDQGSAIYHPGLKRYLFMTSRHLFDAPHPWGPWTLAGDFPSEPAEWQRGYQPGIMTKGLGQNSFWFTIAGQNEPPYITYSFHIGQIVMHTAVQ